jgi:hypothetical protein
MDGWKVRLIHSTDEDSGCCNNSLQNENKEEDGLERCNTADDADTATDDEANIDWNKAR